MITNEVLKNKIEWRLYKKGFRYIVRNKNGQLFAYRMKPRRLLKSWDECKGRVQINYLLDLYKHIKWGDNEPYVIPKSVDWSKVPVDAKILVSKDGKAWYERYFAYFENDTIFAWIDGRTSWSSCGDIGCGWKHAELAEDEEVKGDKNDLIICTKTKNS